VHRQGVSLRIRPFIGRAALALERPAIEQKLFDVRADDGLAGALREPLRDGRYRAEQTRIVVVVDVAPLTSLRRAPPKIITCGAYVSHTALCAA
jgi:hypothetical protein